MKIVNALCGLPIQNKIDLDRFGVIISQEPGGASVTNAHHWIQMYRSGKFARFDYGKKKNMELYGLENAPEYDLSHLSEIDFNCYFFNGEKDAVITKENFGSLTSRIPSNKIKVLDI